MTLTIPQLLLIFAAGLLFSGLFSMAEAAIISQDRHRLSHLAESGNRAARLMKGMLDNMDRLLAAILLFNNIANVMCATAAAVIVTRLSGGGEGAAFAASLGVAFLILVLSEISPKIIGVRHSSAIALALAAPLRALIAAFHPVIAVANFLARGVLALAGIRRVSGLHTAMNVSELQSAVRESNRRARAANDPESGRHYYMVERLLRMAGMPVEKIMTPRRQIDGLNLRDSPFELHKRLNEAEHAKMPVFDGNIDATEGFIDTLRAIKIAARRGAISPSELREIQSPPLFIPAAADALRQLEIMRQRGARMALAVDGAGRVTGLVTFSNFSAAIIGDEDPPENLLPSREGGFILQGDFPLIQLGEIHPNFSAPKTSAASINGLILETAGGVPKPGDEITIGDLRIEILDAGDSSVRSVRLFPPPDSDSAPAENDALI